MTAREKVEYMIRHYADSLEVMRKLDLEIAQHRPISKEEVIDMLTFPGMREDHVMVRHDVDTERLMRIACGYRRLCFQMNQERLREWSEEYGAVARQVEFLKYAIRRLPRRQRELMQALVLDGLSWSRTCERLNISGESITKLRSRALGNMALTLDEYMEAFGLQDCGG